MLAAARESAKGQVIAVMQPTATRGCTICPSSSAPASRCRRRHRGAGRSGGRAPIPGIDCDALVAGLRSHGHKQAIRSMGRRSSQRDQGAGQARRLRGLPRAGSITQWAYALPGELAGLGDGCDRRRCQIFSVMAGLVPAIHVLRKGLPTNHSIAGSTPKLAAPSRFATSVSYSFRVDGGMDIVIDFEIDQPFQSISLVKP